VSTRERERGQIVPLVALMVVAAGVAALWLGRLGGAAVSRAQARTAADMAALAGAVDGRQQAAAIAEANGGRLVGFERRGDEAWAKVEVGRAVAAARARREPGPAGLGAGVGVKGLVPAMRSAIDKAAALLGRPVPITSGFRSSADQARLWARRALNPFPVARPGTSAHERGRAIDVPRSFVPVLLTVARRVGLCQPHPSTDPIHFELCA